jgi:hypothetical protein
MMIKTIIASFTALIVSSPAYAQTESSYQPFRYETSCALMNEGEPMTDLCVVVETRQKGGFLRTRNIFSNRFGLTIKSWFDKEKGFMTWDSHNKFAYKWEYKIGEVGQLGNWSNVMPGFYVQNVSWD